MVKKYIIYLFNLSVLILVVSFSSCIDDEVISSDSSFENVSHDFEELDLPGYIGIQLRMNSSTRSEEEENTQEKNESGLPIEPALTNENVLAPTAESENYHFALFFDKNTEEIKFIVSLDTDELTEDSEEADISNGLNLAIKKVYKSTYDKFEFENGETVDEKIKKFKDYIEGLNVYFLINFDKGLLANSDLKESSSNLEFLETNIKKVDDLKNWQYNSYKITVKNKSGVNTDYFTMTTAMYGKDSIIVPATIVKPENIYFTEENAFNNEPTIKGHVERLAVKYRLNINKGSEGNTIFIPEGCREVKVFNRITTTGDFVITTNSVPWKAVILGYGVNALEKTEYLFKKIQYEDYFSSPAWNYPASYLSYWAEDPHYDIDDIVKGDEFRLDNKIVLEENNSKDGYPHQYRNAIETDTIRSYVNYKDAPYLDYVSFSSINSQPKEFYSLENTFEDLKTFTTHGNYNTLMADGVGPFNYYTAETHFILACQLIIGTENVIRDVYHDEDDIYYASKEHLLTAKLTLLNDRNLTGGSSDIRVLNVNWVGSSDPNHSYDNDLRVISWPKGARLYYKPSDGTMRAAEINDLDTINAHITGGDGKVLIGPKKTNRENGQFYLVAEGVEQPISNNELVSLFHKFSGAIDFYNKGRMYYCAPITHTKTNIGPDSWKTVGDVGVVRNNLYEVTLSGVKAPGHSVAEVGDPIIPMLDPYRDYLSSRVRVLRWHQVSASVTPLETGSN